MAKGVAPAGVCCHTTAPPLDGANLDEEERVPCVVVVTVEVSILGGPVYFPAEGNDSPPDRLPGPAAVVPLSPTVLNGLPPSSIS